VLLQIITNRIGTNTVDLKALELVSRKVAATHGDARMALEIVSDAVGHCEDSLSESELFEEVNNDDSPPVKIKHMMRAIREGNLIKYAEIIRKLPQLTKIVLCIAVAYGHAKGPNAELSLGYLRKLCLIATKICSVR
jgi:cell division control protein 6